jgi:hypothetical protein
MKPGDEHARTTRVIRPVFPECTVRGVVQLADLDLFDRSDPPERTSCGMRSGTIPHAQVVYPSR